MRHPYLLNYILDKTAEIQMNSVLPKSVAIFPFFIELNVETIFKKAVNESLDRI